MEPALTIIKMCGGAKAVADMLGRDPSRVHRWTYEKDKGGTGGVIPADMQAALLEKAVARGIPLEPRHFFPGFHPNENTSPARQPAPGKPAYTDRVSG